MSPGSRLEALARRVLTFEERERKGLVGKGDPSSIAIDGDEARPAVLAFHGFAGTPKELRVVADAAARAGLAARVPRLTGHTDNIRDPIARRTHLTYALNPIRSAIEVLRAGRVVQGELHRVTCPTLVIHGSLDRVCPVENAYRFANRLGTGDVTVRIMPGSGHIVTVDVDRAEVGRAVDAFIARIAR